MAKLSSRLLLPPIVRISVDIVINNLFPEDILDTNVINI